MYKFNIDRQDLYKSDEPEGRTKARLKQMAELGMEESGLAAFGIPGVVSGLYIEKVWSYSEEEWNELIEWVTNLINLRKDEKAS